jgi:hypothetical protein
VSKPPKVGRRGHCKCNATPIRGFWLGFRVQCSFGSTWWHDKGTSCPGGAGDGGGGVGARASAAGTWTSLVANSSITVFIRCCCSTICVMISCCWRNSATMVSSLRGRARFRGVAGALPLGRRTLPLPRLRPASSTTKTHKGDLPPARCVHEQAQNRQTKRRSKLGSLHKDLTEFASWSRHQFCNDLPPLLLSAKYSNLRKTDISTRRGPMLCSSFGGKGSECKR